MRIARCPLCGRDFPADPSTRPKSYPFCTERCRLVDLGRWFNGEYKVSDPIESAEQIEDLLGEGDEGDEGEAR